MPLFPTISLRKSNKYTKKEHWIFYFLVLYLPFSFVFFSVLVVVVCVLFCRLCTLFLWFVFSSSWLLGVSQHRLITWPSNTEYWRPKNKARGCPGKAWENICKNMAFVPALVMGCSFSPDQSSQAKANLRIICILLLFVYLWNTFCVFV